MGKIRLGSDARQAYLDSLVAETDVEEDEAFSRAAQDVAGFVRNGVNDVEVLAEQCCNSFYRDVSWGNMSPREQRAWRAVVRRIQELVQQETK